MSKMPLALALLLTASAAVAAPPKKAPAPKPPAEAASPPPEEIDVDALARAKDEAAAEGEAPAADAAPPETPAPVAETATPAETAAPAEAAAPAPEAAPAAAAPAPATPPLLTRPPDAEEKSIAAGCKSRASSLLDAAEKADYGSATRDFDATMKSALPAAKFKAAWESLAQFGKLQARGQSHLGSGQGYTIVMVPLIFEKANLVAQVACGSDGRIAGFYVKPIEKTEPQF